MWRKGKGFQNQSAVMIPDKGFSKQLHTLSPEFDVVWDWGSEKWEIWRFPEDGKPCHHVLTVQTKDKTYRELGADVLLRLQKSDFLLNFTLTQLVAYFDEMDNQIIRRKEKVFKDKIEAMAKDTFGYVHIVMGRPIESTPMSRACPIFEVPKSMKVRRAICDA